MTASVRLLDIGKIDFSKRDVINPVMDLADLDRALTTLGELLQYRGQSADVSIVGGGALLLSGFHLRPTKDVDIVGMGGEEPLRSAHPLPEYLSLAIADTARAHGLNSDWMNAGPTSLLDLGLPAGFFARANVRDYGALTVRIAHRWDLVCMKVYAAADAMPGSSKHSQDLQVLAPSVDELVRAAAWCRSHDPSQGFATRQLAPLLRAMGVPDAQLP